MTSETLTVFQVGALNQEDLDRDFAVAHSTLFKWMQSARMRMRWVGTGYRALSAEEPALSRRLVVKQQRLAAKAGALADVGGRDLVVECRLGAVGRTSVPFQYRITADGEEIAAGAVTMICVAGKPGALKPSPVPDRIKRLADSGMKPPVYSLSRVARQPPAGAYVYTTVVRFSDEDINKHANHSASARYLCDARTTLAADHHHPLSVLARKPATTFELEYIKESRAGDELKVHLSKCDGGGIAAHIVRRGELLVRGWMDEGGFAAKM